MIDGRLRSPAGDVGFRRPPTTEDSLDNLRRLAAMVELSGTRFRFEADQLPDDGPSPLSIIRSGVVSFFVLINVAAAATLFSAWLAFALAYIAAGALFLALLAFWRSTGRAIIGARTLSLLLSLCLVLALTSIVAGLTL